MSSEIYELLKRTDEQYIVDRAHRRPRFVEDSVREMIRGVAEQFPELPDDAFVWAHQANFETIHTHDVEAERSGTLGEIRQELAGEAHSTHHTGLREWLHRGLLGD
jgi:GTP cyclohydrolase I/GTP cyclohydrolase-4